MGLKNWMSKRKELKESQERFMSLSEEELQDLHQTEKIAYLGIAKKQVTYRGKINAYKDFPVNESYKQVIDMENDFIKEMNNESIEESNEMSELDTQEELKEIREINKPRSKHVYQTIRQM